MKLSDLRLNQLYQAQQAALMRLQLWSIGAMDGRMAEFAKLARAKVFDLAGEDGKLDSGTAYRVQTELMKAWGDAFDEWLKMLEKTRQEAASLPFGVLAAYHEKLIKPKMIPLKEAVVAGTSYVFSPQLRAILRAADDVTVEGLKLSSRLWRLDRDARDGINRILMQGLTDKRSAWDIAQDLEQFLGADADLPRWTSTRLYGLTKADIASGDRTGLITDTAGRTKGVSYNALRLARTEIQRIHHLANDQVMAKMPWIEQEKINLSPSHAETDECDDAANGGDNGDGTYPKGEIILPLHPQCLCYKTAVQDLAAFGDKLSQWVRTGGGFPAMDDYVGYLGVDLGKSLMDDATASALGDWIDGNASEIDVRMQ